MAVALPIQNVVDQIDTARREAQRNETQHRLPHQRWVRKLRREQQRGEHQQVLNPLVRAHRLHEGDAYAYRVHGNARLAHTAINSCL
jgi:hypothetical protein